MLTLRCWGPPIPVAALALAPLLLGTRAPVAPRTVAVPSISSLLPYEVIAGSPSFTLIVSGAQFQPTSRVLWNGSQRPTTYVSATRIEAAITLQDVAAPASVRIVVQNP